MKTRSDPEWREAVKTLAAAKAARDAAEAAYRSALDRVTLLEPEGAQGFGVRVTQVLRAGAIAYAKAVRDLLPGADLEPYRGSESLSYRVEVTK